MDTILKSAKLMSVLEAVGLFIVCYIAIKLLRKAIDKILDRSKHLDPSLKTFFASAVNVLLWAIAVMIVASALGINITSLVAILSVAGVALSLALQGLLANVFSGITLLASRPIAVGNFVEIGGQSGTVRSIGLFYTCLATPDNKIIYVPNGDITGSKIINYSTEPVRRVDLNVGTSYDCPTETVRAAILEAVANTDKVLNDPAPFVALAAYNASNIEYTVRVWCNTEDYWDVHFTLNENIRTSFDRHGVEMSYEHLNVHIMQD